MMAAVCLVVLVVGPIVVGGWMANAYIVFRTSGDDLQLPVLEKSIPSPDDLIKSEVSTAPRAR